MGRRQLPVRRSMCVAAGSIPTLPSHVSRALARGSAFGPRATHSLRSCIVATAIALSVAVAAFNNLVGTVDARWLRGPLPSEVARPAPLPGRRAARVSISGSNWASWRSSALSRPAPWRCAEPSVTALSSGPLRTPCASSPFIGRFSARCRRCTPTRRSAEQIDKSSVAHRSSSRANS
jgi:hypothetical protein